MFEELFTVRSFTSRKFTLALIFVLVSVSVNSWSAQLYRYKDADGNTVLGLTIPPELIPQGYDILSASGRLVERVPPALTPEQIAERDKELERQRLAEIERKKQEEYDAQLKQWYGEPDTAVGVLKRQATDIISVVKVELSKIERLKKEIESSQSQAAELQRKGIVVPESIPETIARLETEIQNSKTSISEREQNYKDVLAEFDAIIRRLEIISNSNSESYAPLLEELNQSMTELLGKVEIL